jgi:hypothetical protein
MKHVIQGMKAAAALSFLLGFCPNTVLAEDTSPPKATATRPVQDRPGQTSLPSTAAPATGTQTTGATNQDPTTKKMNEEEKKKLDIEGK